MTLLDNSDVGYHLDLEELFKDSAKCRAALQNNEDKIEEFNKWSENMVRFVRTILEEASKMAHLLPNLESQIDRFSSFEEAFGVRKTVEVFDIISNLLRNTQSANYKLISNISSRLLIPLQKYFQEDFKALKDSRKSFDKTSEKYDGILNRYYSLSKFKDVSDLDEDLAQLYENRVSYFEQYSDHVTKIKNFKETIDLLFLEKITILVDDLSDFFKNLSENFDSVKNQLDKGRQEFEKLNKQSEELRTKNESDREAIVERAREIWNPNATISRKLGTEKHGSLLMKRKKPTLGTPWKRVFAIISNGQFYYESIGKIRGTIEANDKQNVMMCEIRPLDLNDRRFCFEIYTGQQSQIYQAESEDDMMDWINTFHAAKSEMVHQQRSPRIAPVSPKSISEYSEEGTATSIPPKFDYENDGVLKKWNEELHKQFSELDESEVTLCSFPASLHTDIWTQGRVFVTQYAVYFYSSIFGIGTKIIFPLKEIMKIDIVQTSFVTVINFTLSGETKDVTLKTFNSVDKSSSVMIEDLQVLHRNTQSSEPLNSFELFKQLKKSSIEENIEEEPEELKELKETTESLAEVLDSSTRMKAELPSKGVDCGCANHMDVRSVNTVIPIDCALAFDLMFGSACPVQLAVHEKRHNRKHKISAWKEDPESGLETREEFYMFPLNNPLSRAKETECYVTIKLTKKIPGRCYIVDCKTNTPNIPYADSFFTQSRYCITWAGPEQSRISICLGITWLKSPFVKSIIKSATLKTFNEFCVDYMACLRQEIAAKMGPTAVIGESNAVDTSLNAEEGMNETISSDQKEEKSKDLLESSIKSWWIFSFLNENKISISLFLFAFILGRFFGPSSTPSSAMIGSYDIEMEAWREMNSSSTMIIKSPGNSDRWKSEKFEKTHRQLHRLHQDFSAIRQAIWYTLKRMNALEKRVYKAKMAAVMGDGLLACFDRMEEESCRILQDKWKILLKE